MGILSAYVGPHMARATIDAHAVKLELDLERLKRADLELLAQRVALGLKVFVGPAKAGEAALAVRSVGSQLPESAPSGSAKEASR